MSWRRRQTLPAHPTWATLGKEGQDMTGQASSPTANAAGKARTRRAVTAQLAALMVGGSLVGCGVGRQQTGRPDGVLQGRVTLYGWDQEPISSTRRRAMDGLRAKHPQLTVEQETTSAGGNVYLDKIQTMIAGDTPPDMFIVQDSWLPMFLTRKLALNLDPLVKRDKYDLSDFPKGAIEAYRYQGGLYGLPDNITSNGFFVNHEQFKQSGVEPPPTNADAKGWTFDVLLQHLQQLASRVKTDPPTFGIIPNTSLQGWLAWVRSNGGDLLTKDGSATALDSSGAT